ncbi:MAG: integrase [Gammaproteobacteria bacterium]
MRSGYPRGTVQCEAQSTQPAGKQYKVSDDYGLHILVKPSGAKCWRYKYRFAGKEKVLALGVYPEVSLKQAREEHQAARAMLREGKDPSAVKRQQAAERVAAGRNSFEAIARQWHAKTKVKWSTGHAVHVLHEMERTLFPKLGRLPVREIEPATLLTCIQQIEKRGALDVASRALQRAGRVFQCAIQTQRLEHNPALALQGVLHQRPVVHQHAMPAEELGPFLVLTFVRPGELRGARWEEFDRKAKRWTIPAKRMKGGKREHTVPLSVQALEVLAELESYTGSSPYLFPNDRNDHKPMSENALSYAMQRMGYKGCATAHGFRSTASTLLNERGEFSPDVIERQLAHVEGNKVRAAYNRSEYLDERTVMMGWWGNFVAEQSA